jgi:hypothetical protein
VLQFHASIAHKRNFLEIFLHHPLEVVAKISINKKYVKIALMVGKKDIRLLFVNVLPTLHFDWKKEEPAGDAAPPLRYLIAKALIVAQN